MPNLVDIIAYILIRTKNSDIMTKYRITKMIYLADWCSSASYYRRLTNINWFFDNYGPFVWDVHDTVVSSNLFSIEYGTTYYGNEKMIFRIDNYDYHPNLTPEEANVIDYVIDQTINLSTSDFTKLVYGTYPIKTSPRYSHIDIMSKAQEFNNLRENNALNK